MVPCMVQHIPAYMAPKMVPEIIILPEELLIMAEGLLCDLWYFFYLVLKGLVPQWGSQPERPNESLETLNTAFSDQHENGK